MVTDPGLSAMAAKRYLIVNADDFGQSEGVNLTMLPPGLTELGCHPGTGDDLDTIYRRERAEEVRTLCAPQFRTALVMMEIELRSFLDLPSA